MRLVTCCRSSLNSGSDMSPFTPSTLTFSGMVTFTGPTLLSVMLPESRPWILIVYLCPLRIGSLLMSRDHTDSSALFQPVGPRDYTLPECAASLPSFHCIPDRLRRGCFSACG